MNASTSLVARVDAYLRRSAITRFVPQLRSRYPRLYSWVRGALDRALPFSSQHHLARHQARAVEHFCRLVPVAARESLVLEIGSDSEGRVLRELIARGAPMAVGVNPAFGTSPPDETVVSQLPRCAILKAGDARDLDFPDSYFSAVFSVSVFEHLLDFPRCLRSMWRVLRPGGYVYADFGPIWSASVGHHVCAFGDGREARHFKPETNPVPNHAHLLRTADELRDQLKDHVPPNLLQSIIAWIYEGSDINRLFYEDYLRHIEASSFEIVVHETDVEYVGRHTRIELERRYPGFRRFDVRNARVLLRKPIQS